MKPAIDLEALAAEMQRASPMAIELGAHQALALLGTIQLALRHPKHTGPSADQVRAIAQLIELRLGVSGPQLKALCAAGWNADDEDDGR